jgi:hypothetical protein
MILLTTIILNSISILLLTFPYSPYNWRGCLYCRLQAVSFQSHRFTTVTKTCTEQPKLVDILLISLAGLGLMFYWRKQRKRETQTTRFYPQSKENALDARIFNSIFLQGIRWPKVVQIVVGETENRARLVLAGPYQQSMMSICH